MSRTGITSCWPTRNSAIWRRGSSARRPGLEFRSLDSGSRQRGASGADGERRRRARWPAAALLLHLAAGLGPVLEAAEVEDLLVAHVFEQLPGERRAAAG